jgi:hypothetical protein
VPQLVRTLLGLIVAPLAAQPFVWGIFGLGALYMGWQRFLGLTLTISYAGTLAVGVPLHLILCWRRATSLGAYAVAGLIAAPLFVCLWLVDIGIADHSPDWTPHWEMIGAFFALMTPSIFFVIFTVPVAIAFWAIARPDRRTAVPLADNAGEQECSPK